MESNAPQERPQSAPQRRFNPAMVKVSLIALIFGLLQIPLYLILGTIEERQRYNVEYARDYAGWGAGEQTVVGPVLTVPYRYIDTEEQTLSSDSSHVRVKREAIGYLHLFPETLDVSGNMVPEIRDGGKFKNILYSAALDFKGKFDTSEIAQKKIDYNDLMWDDAFLALGISDLRGIKDETHLKWDGQSFKFLPGTNGLCMVESGQYVPLKKVKKSGESTFSFTLHLNGSRELSIFPGGKESKITIGSKWKNPNFTGGFLPVRRVSDPKNGFRAEWQVSYFNRNTPQVWTSRERDLRNSLSQYMAGVQLATPVEFYQTAIRAAKYGCLFIVFPFLTFFIFEVITRIRIHEMQYLLVGLSLSLFFLLLIAISEYWPFVWAYTIASVATIIQITAYTRAFSLSRSARLWKIMCGSLSALYVYLYVLLQLEDMSLLFGALGLFLALTFVLYATRHINWHTIGREQANAT